MNIQCGAWRVFNDDVVAPHTGFGTPPHQDMEIMTIVLDGEVTPEDSLGTKAVIQAGDVQRMSAGTGIRHAEFNLGEVPAHFYQIWLYPDTSGLPPSYDQQSFAGTVWTNRLVPVASGQGLPDVVTFHTDATVYLGALEAHRSVTHATNGTRRVFVYLTEGEFAVDGAQLYTKDQGRIDAEAPLTLTAHQDTRFVLIDVPLVSGLGVRSGDLTGRTALGGASRACATTLRGPRRGLSAPTGPRAVEGKHARSQVLRTERGVLHDDTDPI